MKSGKTTEARDHVRTIFRSLFLFISWTRPRSRASTNGPFLTERDMLRLLLRLAVPRPDDQEIRLRPAPRPVPHPRLPPRRLGGHARRGLALAAAVRMVTRGHRDAPGLRSKAHVAGPAGLPEALVLVVQVGNLPDRRHAAQRHATHLAGRQPNGGVVAFLGQQLGRAARRPDDLAALARDELDVVDRGAQRDAGERQGVPDPGLGIGAGDHDVAHLQAVGKEHVALLAVTVVKEADPGRAVRVVLDRRDLGRHADLVAPEVDDAVGLLLAAAAVANGQAALVVPARAALLRLEERLVGLLGCDLLERRAGHEPPAGRGGLVASQRHGYTPSKNSIFWPAASVTIALRQGVVQPVIRPRLVPRRFSLAFVVRMLTAVTWTLKSSSTAALTWIFDASP